MQSSQIAITYCNHKQTVFNANAVYAFSSAKVYVGYLHSKDDTGFIDNALAQQTVVPGIEMLKGSGHVDNGTYAGVTWHATLALTLTGAAYYDHMSNAAIGMRGGCSECRAHKKGAANGTFFTTTSFC
jgi:predicted porin